MLHGVTKRDVPGAMIVDDVGVAAFVEMAAHVTALDRKFEQSAPRGREPPRDQAATLDLLIEALERVNETLFSPVISLGLEALRNTALGSRAALFSLPCDVKGKQRSQFDFTVWEIQAFSAAVLEFGFRLEGAGSLPRIAADISRAIGECNFPKATPRAVEGWRETCPMWAETRDAEKAPKKSRRAAEIRILGQQHRHEMYNFYLNGLAQEWLHPDRPPRTTRDAIALLKHHCRSVIFRGNPKSDEDFGCD